MDVNGLHKKEGVRLLLGSGSHCLQQEGNPPTNPMLPRRILVRVAARTLWARLGARSRAPATVPCSRRLPGVSVPVGLPGWRSGCNVPATTGRATLLPFTLWRVFNLKMDLVLHEVCLFFPSGHSGTECGEGLVP